MTEEEMARQEEREGEKGVKNGAGIKGDQRRDDHKKGGEKIKEKEDWSRGTAGWKDAPILHGSQMHLQHIYYRTALQTCCCFISRMQARGQREQRAGKKAEI